MGAANVIPGVSGGTIALVVGIYEKLIHSIKSVDVTAIKLLMQLKFKELAAHTNLGFLVAVFAGMGLSILTLARLLEYLLMAHETLVMAFFFGLILLSVYYVAKTVDQWSATALLAFVVGTCIAIGIALLTPASEDASFLYVALCGVAAICSMILPGLSGSFILIIMGNYMLVLGGINRFDMGILVPLMVGCIVGIVLFAQLLSWVFKHYRDATISLMSGFVLGSLLIIWPWKEEQPLLDAAGIPILKDGETVIGGYAWNWPDLALPETWMAAGLVVAGMATIWLMEWLSADEQSEAPA